MTKQFVSIVTIEQAWAELQAVPSYVEQQAAAFAAETSLELAPLSDHELLALIRAEQAEKAAGDEVAQIEADLLDVGLFMLERALQLA